MLFCYVEVNHIRIFRNAYKINFCRLHCDGNFSVLYHTDRIFPHSQRNTEGEVDIVKYCQIYSVSKRTRFQIYNDQR